METKNIVEGGCVQQLPADTSAGGGAVAAVAGEAGDLLSAALSGNVVGALKSKAIEKGKQLATNALVKMFSTTAGSKPAKPPWTGMGKVTPPGSAAAASASAAYNSVHGAPEASGSGQPSAPGMPSPNYNDAPASGTASPAASSASGCRTQVGTVIGPDGASIPVYYDASRGTSSYLPVGKEGNSEPAIVLGADARDTTGNPNSLIAPDGTALIRAKVDHEAQHAYDDYACGTRTGQTNYDGNAKYWEFSEPNASDVGEAAAQKYGYSDYEAEQHKKSNDAGWWDQFIVYLNRKNQERENAKKPPAPAPRTPACPNSGNTDVIPIDVKRTTPDSDDCLPKP